MARQIVILVLHSFIYLFFFGDNKNIEFGKIKPLLFSWINGRFVFFQHFLFHKFCRKVNFLHFSIKKKRTVWTIHFAPPPVINIYFTRKIYVKFNFINVAVDWLQICGDEVPILFCFEKRVLKIFATACLLQNFSISFYLDFLEIKFYFHA